MTVPSKLSPAVHVDTPVTIFAFICTVEALRPPNVVLCDVLILENIYNIHITNIKTLKNGRLLL